MFTKIDCIRLKVPNLQDGLDFYHHHLGLDILWKTKNAVALKLQNDESEIVLYTEDTDLTGIELDFKVDDVEKFVEYFTNIGGTILSGPFDIDIGKCAVLQDPWHHQYVVLDSQKGLYQVNDNKEVIKVEKNISS
ncbi:VOC family protein [Candidatus Lokiarchaeum ossiferum]|uniref:VOC family protein n=1 Tax=Candidatus Lokiarchaeum ossiferum TaxID=2951803 RepID=UPI00352D0140